MLAFYKTKSASIASTWRHCRCWWGQQLLQHGRCNCSRVCFTAAGCSDCVSDWYWIPVKPHADYWSVWWPAVNHQCHRRSTVHSQTAFACWCCEQLWQNWWLMIIQLTVINNIYPLLFSCSMKSNFWLWCFTWLEKQFSSVYIVWYSVSGESCWKLTIFCDERG